MNRGTTGVNSLPKTVTRKRHDCDLNPGPSAPESSTLITRLPSHPSLHTGTDIDDDKFRGRVNGGGKCPRVSQTDLERSISRRCVGRLRSCGSSYQPGSCLGPRHNHTRDRCPGPPAPAVRHTTPRPTLPTHTPQRSHATNN